jgi:hypothetical protein
VKLDAHANPALVAWLAEQSDDPPRSFRVHRRVSMENLRCHPDLCERVHGLASELPGAAGRYVEGFAILLDEHGVVFAIAAGTSWLAFLLPARTHSAVVRSQWGLRDLGGEWVDVDPWMTDVPAYEGLRRLRGWSRAAHAYAHARAASATEPGPRVRRPPRGDR